MIANVAIAISDSISVTFGLIHHTRPALGVQKRRSSQPKRDLSSQSNRFSPAANISPLAFVARAIAGRHIPASHQPRGRSLRRNHHQRHHFPRQPILLEITRQQHRPIHRLELTQMHRFPGLGLLQRRIGGKGTDRGP